MEIELNRFTPAEQATFRLRALYEQAGYRKYRASRFEEYALYQEYQRFLPDAQVITFTDLDGKLRAIKPDVTLSIAKTAQPAAGECKRFYYNEEVCRPSRESHTFQTIHQMGLESMGAVDADEQAAVVRLALQSLTALDVPTVLEISHMGYLTGLLDALHVPAEARAKLLDFLRAKNAHELRTAALAAGLDESAAAALTGLLDLHGPLGATLAAARAACRCETQRAALEELQALQNALGEAGRGARLDLSMADEMEYYNGLVFTGYVAGIPCAVLKGGRYDYLMQRFTPGANAIGFAIYLDELERLAAPLPPRAAAGPREKLAEHCPAEGPPRRQGVQAAGRSGLQRHRGLQRHPQARGREPRRLCAVLPRQAQRRCDLRRARRGRHRHRRQRHSDRVRRRRV